MDIDLTRPPLSLPDINRKRYEHKMQLKIVKKREFIFSIGSAVVVLAGLALLLTSHYLQLINDPNDLMIILGITGFFFLSYTRIRDSYECKRMIIQHHLYELTEMDTSFAPDECVNFVDWCQQDSSLRDFQHHLVKLGRNPIIKEYRAAESWIELQQASLACVQMKTPI